MARETTFTAVSKGVGRPDYSQEIAAARERPGLLLKANQTLIIYGAVWSSIASIMPHVLSPLAAGETDDLVNYATGVAGALTVPEGYTLTPITALYSFSQDGILHLYFDGQLNAILGVPTGGNVLYLAEVITWSTALTDPTGASAHQVLVQLTNLGGGDLIGTCFISAVLEAVGTGPLPPTKTVKCKFCGLMTPVPRATSRVICPSCGKLNIYFDLSKFRGTR